MRSLWAGEALALAHWGRLVIPKKTHPQSVLSTETPYYPRIRPISRSVFLFFIFFPRVDGFHTECSGEGFRASQPSSVTHLGWGQTVDAHWVTGAHGPWAAASQSVVQLQTLFRGCTHACSLETLCSQVFVQIKSLHMNMQESNHQERLLAKFIKFCEWLCKEHPGRATPALKLVNPSSTAIRWGRSDGDFFYCCLTVRWTLAMRHRLKAPSQAVWGIRLKDFS